MPLLYVGVEIVGVRVRAGVATPSARAEPKPDRNEPISEPTLGTAGCAAPATVYNAESVSMLLMVRIGTFASDSDWTFATGESVCCGDGGVAFATVELEDGPAVSEEKEAPSLGFGTGIVARTMNKMSARMMTARGKRLLHQTRSNSEMLY